MKRNIQLARLQANYLFPEIQARKREYLHHHPEAELISLGIGDTTEPLTPTVSDALKSASAALATSSEYSGYGPEQGMAALRQLIAARIYDHRVTPDEIFISDGAKCDLGRLQMLFGPSVSIAVQDPTYPVYVEGSIIQGVNTIVTMPSSPENGFFPILEETPRTDLIYFCSPNNPTGSVASRSQLEQLVAFARANRSIIIFDAAYANYIRDPALPRSIFEIEGAKEVAIEINSFSKLAGFTGVRLSWSVVPMELRYDDGASVRNDWHRVVSTIFNGASVIAQKGGCAVLSESGWAETMMLTDFYLENAAILRMALKQQGLEVFGGIHAPYLWVRFQGCKSWDIFQQFLEQYHIIITPGSGFGAEGEGFVRFSAFGHREHILKAVERLQCSAFQPAGVL